MNLLTTTNNLEQLSRTTPHLSIEMAAAQKQTVDSLPEYLRDLNKSANIFSSGDYSYLDGLPVRPTKRRRFIPRDESCIGGDGTCQSTMDNDVVVISHSTFWTYRYFMISSTALLIGISSLLWRRKTALVGGDASANNTAQSYGKKMRQKNKKDTSILVDSSTGSVEVVHKSGSSSIADPPLEVQLTSSEESEEIHEGNCDTSTTDDAARESDGALDVQDRSMMSSSTDAVVRHQDARDRPDSISELIRPCRHGGNLTDIQIEHLAQRWESKGLDRQKSLELAAHFEMNMLFFREVQHLLSVSAFGLMERFAFMHSTSLDQMRQQHQEQIDAPHLESINRYRRRMVYMPLNARIFTRCILAAIASKYCFMRGYISVWDILPTFNNAIGTLYSTMITGCSFETTELTMESSYGFDYLSSYLYQGVETLSCTFLCSIKILWYALLLVFCQQYIPRSISCVIIAAFFVDWMSIIQLGMAIAAVNILLTVLLCKLMDTKCSNLEVCASARLYKQCIPICEVLSLFPSILLGYCLSLHST